MLGGVGGMRNVLLGRKWNAADGIGVGAGGTTL